MAHDIGGIPLSVLQQGADTSEAYGMGPLKMEGRTEFLDVEVDRLRQRDAMLAERAHVLQSGMQESANRLNDIEIEREGLSVALANLENASSRISGPELNTAIGGYPGPYLAGDKVGRP